MALNWSMLRFFKNLDIIAGNADTNGQGGHLVLQAGEGSTAGSGQGGDVYVVGGSAYSGSSAGGSIFLNPGQKAGASLQGAVVVNQLSSLIMGTGALATTDVSGFLYLTTSPGIPTGTPETRTGTAPIHIDSTNNNLYAYMTGAWHRLNTRQKHTFAGSGIPTTGNDKTNWIYVDQDCVALTASLVAKTAPSGGSFVVVIKSSTDNGATFPTTVATITVTTGNNVGTTTSTTALTAGTLLRFDITSVNGAADWTAQLNVAG